MIAGLKPYPAMKESDVPWLGEVPQHWEVRKLRNVLAGVTERNRADLPLLSVVREKGVIYRDTTSNDENHNFIPDDLSNYKVVKAGQFAMNKMKAWQGSYGVSPCDGIVSPAYFVFEVNGVDGDFFHSAIRSKAYVSFFTQASDGVRIGQWDLSQSRMSEITFFVPSLAEQHAIVRFLDYADHRIRSCITRRQKLIALLNEQKRAIISRAVTSGLDSVAVSRIQPSSRYVNDEVARIRPERVFSSPGRIPWLTTMPNHWGQISSRRLFTARKELARPDDVQLSATQAYGVIPQEEFEQKVGRRVTKILLHLEKRRHVEKDDFVISMRSFQGGIERALAAGCIRSSYVVLRSISRVDVGYFSYLFKSDAYIKALQATSSFIRDGQDLNFGNFCLIDLPIVPLDEQRAISAFLDEANSDINRAISQARREADLLREYRTRLIADVVTGKLDVREAAARLPEETDTLAPDVAEDDVTEEREEDDDPEITE